MSGLKAVKVSESPGGKARQVVYHEGEGRNRRSLTRHEVRIGASEWAYSPPPVSLDRWPAGKNFLRREE